MIYGSPYITGWSRAQDTGASNAPLHGDVQHISGRGGFHLQKSRPLIPLINRFSSGLVSLRDGFGGRCRGGLHQPSTSPPGCSRGVALQGCVARGSTRAGAPDDQPCPR